MAIAWAIEGDPRELAGRLVAAAREDPAWLDRLATELERSRAVDQLRRTLEVWGLSQSEAARIFGVSRQALGKWLRVGVPAERVEAVADLAAATDVFVHHLKRDRIPAVVRRTADALGGTSLLAMAAAGDTRGVLAASRAMFDVAAMQP